MEEVNNCTSFFFFLKELLDILEKYAYSRCCWEWQEEIDATLMSLQ